MKPGRTTVWIFFRRSPRNRKTDQKDREGGSVQQTIPWAFGIFAPLNEMPVFINLIKKEAFLVYFTNAAARTMNTLS
jgi:hypothetical protein